MNLQSIRESIGKIEALIGEVEANEKAFEDWFSALTQSAPSLKAETITVTSENFKKAMRQAFKAGIKSARLP